MRLYRDSKGYPGKIILESSMHILGNLGNNNYLKVADVIDPNAPIRLITRSSKCTSPLQRFRFQYKRLREEHMQAIERAMQAIN
jgi:hypothetical protein